MTNAICIKCGRLCRFKYYKVTPGRCLCRSCYEKLFNAPDPETVSISYPPEGGKHNG